MASACISASEPKRGTVCAERRWAMANEAAGRTLEANREAQRKDYHDKDEQERIKKNRKLDGIWNFCNGTRNAKLEYQRTWANTSGGMAEGSVLFSQLDDINR